MNILLVTFRYPVLRPDLKSDVLALHHFTTEWIKACLLYTSRCV